MASEAMAAVLLHSADLLRVDLDGVFTLVSPLFVNDRSSSCRVVHSH